MTNTSTIRHAVWMLVILCLQLATANAIAQESYRPSDPIASIQGEPILLGELNYMLTSKLGAKDSSAVSIDVKKAASASLVRQHQAMKTLREQGGESLQTLLDQDWELFVQGLKRKGLSIDQFSQQRLTNEKSIRASRDWDSAWRRYLKSKMTDANLKRYYQLHSEKFASARWNVSHIFLPIDKDVDDAAEIATFRLKQIVDELSPQSLPAEQRAKRFAELAVSESDGATAQQGGKLGWVSGTGALPKTVMDAIRETEVGSISAPTRSPLGYHLILVHEKTVSQIPYEQVTDLNPLRRDAANLLFEALVARQSNVPVIWYIKTLQPPSKEAP